MDCGHPFSIGPSAAEILAFDGRAEIVAVFDRCFYLSAPRGLVCFGAQSLGNGPINVLLDLQNTAPNWNALGITPRLKGVVGAGNVSIGKYFSVYLRGVHHWHPPAWPVVQCEALRKGLDEIRRLALPLCPAEGLSSLIFGGDPDRTARAAEGLVRELPTALSRSLHIGKPSADLQRTSTLLLGLGPGLTPSGDDLLGGMFIALSALGYETLRDSLWRVLEPELGHLTNGISSVHLAAAANGLAASAVHEAAVALLRADLETLPRHVQSIRSIGHSSGFDILAGFVLACEAIMSQSGE